MFYRSALPLAQALPHSGQTGHRCMETVIFIEKSKNSFNLVYFNYLTTSLVIS